MKRLSLLLNYLFGASRSTKKLSLYVLDSAFILISLAVSVDAVYMGLNVPKAYALVALVLCSSQIAFMQLGFYRTIVRHMNARSFMLLIVGGLMSAAMLTGVCFAFKMPFDLAFAVQYWILLTVLVVGSRFFVLSVDEIVKNHMRKGVAIYGAGEAGRELARSLSKSKLYRVVCFFDDDVSLHGTVLNGFKVLPPGSIDSAREKYSIERILLAIPSATQLERLKIIGRLESLPVAVQTIASMEEIVSGSVKLEQLKELEIEDLLGRDKVLPSNRLLGMCVSNKSVMVTGAGGSIGSELCRQIFKLKPKVLVLYEVSEFALYSIESELRKLAGNEEYREILIIALLGSVQNRARLLKAMQLYSVETVYHAAAYKHVPIVEHNIVEGVYNNVFGTWNAAEAAVEAGVERFVLISTDKAVRPTNVMGASKRLAELVLQGMNTRQNSTILTMVRFGNVLGSSGSVVPLFREQIESGGPVTVTHKDIIRYFMTIPEAAQLVIQAGAMGSGGDVFVLDMGEQVKISDLAKRMIHLMGLSVRDNDNPEGDISIKYTGLRPGEKLYEELLIGDNVVGTSHPKVMRAEEAFLNWEKIELALRKMEAACVNMDCEGIIELLKELPAAYTAVSPMCDYLLDKHESKVVSFK